MLLVNGLILVITAILVAAFIGWKTFSDLQNLGSRSSKGFESIAKSHIGNMKKMIPVVAVGVLGMVLIVAHVIIRALG